MQWTGGERGGEEVKAAKGVEEGMQRREWRKRCSGGKEAAMGVEGRGN